MENQKESSTEFCNHEENLKALEGEEELLHNKELKPRKQKKRGGANRVTVNIIILMVLGFIVYAFTVPMFPNYTVRTRAAEGFVFASSYKNLVVDNAVNGFPIGYGAPKFVPTKNTEAIWVDEVSGVIYIATNAEKTKGGIVFALVPRSEGKRLESGVIPQGRIEWECQVINLSYFNLSSDIPSECRNKFGF